MNPDFPNYSAVSSVSLGGTAPDITFVGGAGSGGKTTFDDIKIVKRLDDCTIQLFKTLANNTPLGKVTIAIMAPAVGAAPPTHLLDIVLTNVQITSDEFAEAVGGRPSEVVALNWQKITITHVPSGVSFSWDKVTGASF